MSCQEKHGKSNGKHENKGSETHLTGKHPLESVPHVEAKTLSEEYLLQNVKACKKSVL